MRKVIAMTTLPLTGRCQCGAIQYEITEPPLTVVNCHCANCQRVSGSAFATNAMIKSDSFHFTTGEPQRVDWQAESGNQRYGLFCGSCGNRIAHCGDPDTGIVSLRLGTLDDTSWVQSVGDIWTDFAQPWVSFSEDRLQFPRHPEKFSVLFEPFSKLNLF